MFVSFLQPSFGHSYLTKGLLYVQTSYFFGLEDGNEVKCLPKSLYSSSSKSKGSHYPTRPFIKNPALWLSDKHNDNVETPLLFKYISHNLAFRSFPANSPKFYPFVLLPLTYPFSLSYTASTT